MASLETEHAELLAQANRELAEFGRMLPDTYMKLQGAQAGIAQFEAKAQLAEKALGSLAKTFTSAAGAMYKGEKGMSAYNQSVDAAADAMIALTGIVAVMTGGISVLSAGIMAAVGATAKYVKASNEQTDALFKSYQELSRIGAAGADGLRGIYGDMQKLGLGVQDLGKMVALMTDGAKDLSNFGGTVVQGRKRFTDLNVEMKDFRGNLYRAGMTQDEVNESILGYIKLQSRVGLIQNRTTEEIAESTKKYLIEQDALTKLTGMNRKEQEDARQQLRNIEQYQGTMLQLKAMGKTGEDAANEIENFILAIGRTAPQAAKGLAGLTANLSSEEARMQNLLTSGEADRILDQLKKRQINAAEATQRYGDAVAKTVKTQGSVLAQNQNFANLMGSISEAVEIASKTQNGAYRKAAEEAAKQQRRQGMIDKVASEKEINIQADLIKTQQDSMNNMQDFVRNGVAPATTAMSWFSKVVENVTSLLPGAGKFRAQMDAERKHREYVEKLKKQEKEAYDKYIEKRLAEEAATNEAEKAAAHAEAEAAKAAFTQIQTGRAREEVKGAAPEEKRGLLSGAYNNYLKKMIQVESGGRNIANQSGAGGAATSSAYGIAQITRSTFEGLAKKAGEGNALKGKSFEDMKGNVDLQWEAARQLTEQNRSLLESKQLSTTDSALYLAHFLGAGTAAKVLQRPDTFPLSGVLTRQQIEANPVLQSMGTVGKLKEWASAKMGGAGYDTPKYADGGELGAGKIGIAGEAGPEVVTGPATITPMRELMSSFDAMISLLSANQAALMDIARSTKSNVDINDKMLRMQS